MTTSRTAPGLPTHFAEFPGGGLWPAWDRGGGLALVDPRTHPPGRPGLPFGDPGLVYDPGRPRRLGVPGDVVAAAGRSDPPGFVTVPCRPAAV